MARNVFHLIACLLILLMTGCVDRPTAEPVPTRPPVDENGSATEFIGVRSSSNTTIELYFTGAVGKPAADASLYRIFGPQHCDLRDYRAQLNVTKAAVDEGGSVVMLTTAPQAGITYELVFSGMQDARGSPVAGTIEQDAPVFFIGTAATAAAQSDKDGISDADEQVGWMVRTSTGQGDHLCRDVNSDPLIDDTDGDGVADSAERGFGTDPRSPDTDGDSLSDQEEVIEFFSSPLISDTDKDGILDGIEATRLHTSPALADSDGDGLTDAQEIATGGTNPLLANLPELSLDLYGSPSIILNISAKESKEGIQIATSLDQEREEKVNTDNSSTKMSIENTVKLHTEAKVGTSDWPPSASAELTTDTEFKHGYFHETSSNWTHSSVAESKKTFEDTTKNLTEISYNDGMLWVPMKIRNHSELTFKVKDLRVIAYRMLPNGSFSAVGTLTPGKASNKERTVTGWEESPLCADASDPSTCGNILGPGGEIILVLGADSLPAQEMKALVQDPSALMFEIGAYSMFQLDDWGVKETVNYAKLGESVIQRTGVLVIDPGDGNVGRYMVSTNGHRLPDGSGMGLTMKEAFDDVVGITDYELCQNKPALCRIRNAVTFRCDEEPLVDNLPVECPAESLAAAQKEKAEKQLPLYPYIPKGFWMVAGTGPQFDHPDGIDFNTMRLMSGERISLVYMLDSDGDGIFDREEYLLGTDKNKTDTDGDGLDDYQETKEGWNITPEWQAAYTVYPDPRFSDMDDDFLSDFTESHLKTDPYLQDTDKDNIIDSVDPFPIFSPCTDPTYLGMTTWWDGSSTGTRVDDIMVAEPLAKVKSDAIIVGDTGSITDDVIFQQNWRNKTLGIDIPNEKVFRFNLQSPTQNTQYLEVKDDKNHFSIHSNSDFSISAWVYWDGLAQDAPYATILSKGLPGSATYSLSILPDGKVMFTIFRNVHEKRWYCWFASACDDNSEADADYNYLDALTTGWYPELDAETVIKKKTWTQVTATFGGETMRIYLNGKKAAEGITIHNWGDDWNKRRRTTNSLVSNTNSLIIGVEGYSNNIRPFRGMLDDIQFYTRMLTPQNVKELYGYGVCQPGK